MSTQLILLPQTHLGVSSGTGVVELVSDGALFSTINASVGLSVNSIAPQTQAVNTLTPIINTWYRWKTIPGGTGGWSTPAAPYMLLQNLVLNTVSPASASGVFQKLSNLSIGVNYDIEVVVSAPSPPVLGAQHSIRILLYTGSTGSYSGFSPYTAPNGFYGTINTSFIAQSSNDIITISNYGSVAEDVIIESISIKGSTAQTLGAGNGQVICDLYQEEDIPLTLSVDDFKNVTEQVKSYSKDFNLPATKRNNRIFNNMFDITRADDGVIFNPYVKTTCLLKQDGFIIFEGYLRLIDVKDKDGEISYNVNLYSEVIALADVLKDRTFSQLDFTELKHEYDKSQIKLSWNDSGAGITYLNPSTSGFRDANDTVKYPFIDWNHQYILGSVGPELTTLESSFRPCIQLKYLIQNIFAATDFNYTSNFFDSADFDKLYMDFNWGADNTPNLTAVTVFEASIDPLATQSFATTNYTNLNLDIWYFPTGTGPQVSFVPPNYNITTNRITSTSTNEQYDIYNSYGIRNTSGSTATIECRWLKNSTTAINYTTQTLTAGQIWYWSGNVSENLINIGDTLEAQFRASAGSSIKQFVASSAPGGTNAIFSVNTLNITTNVILQTLRGELVQWDFLKGIMTMFNLVSMIDENNPANILIEPYNDVFVTNPNTKELDWTDKVDVSEMSLKPLTDLNKNTIFKFVEDDDDYTFMKYKFSTSGHLYGSKKLDASTSGTTSGLPTTLEGTKEIVAEPFAATVSKQLESLYSDFVVPAIYAMNDDLSSEGFDNLPRILYNVGKKTLVGLTYHIPAQNGLSSENQPDFLQFSHLSEIPAITPATDKDFVFESSQLFPGTGDPPVDNLFNTYWAAYFDELYHADTRVMTLKVNLSPSDIATFKFYDKVFIRNRIFRVNKIEYKPNSLAKVEFILIP